MATAVATQSKMVQQTFAWDVEVEGGRVATPKSHVNVTTVSQSTSQRRGRCEHIGGVMSNVLGKYGISLDDLLGEIEAQRAARLQATTG